MLVVGMDGYVELWEPALWDANVLQQIDNQELTAELFAAPEYLTRDFCR
ncbi:MAG: hypothetical protein R2851_25735 [Caldilineaceae bacterium]